MIGCIKEGGRLWMKVTRCVCVCHLLLSDWLYKRRRQVVDEGDKVCMCVSLITE